jgi:hypothetical protein
VITWRVPVVVLVLLAALGAIGYASFPHKAARNCCLVAVPEKLPANDAPGAAGWVWPDGVPGWKPGETVGSVNLSGVQPIELVPAEVDAARAGIDGQNVRVLQSMRAGRHGAMAILAGPMLDYAKPVPTCLGAMLQGDVPVTWLCPVPHELASAHVLVVAARIPAEHNALYLVGVARGDVDKVVLTGVSPGISVLYQRSKTWGQFALGTAAEPSASLRVYGHGQLLETVSLALKPGQQRVFR